MKRLSVPSGQRPAPADVGKEDRGGLENSGNDSILGFTGFAGVADAAHVFAPAQALHK